MVSKLYYSRGDRNLVVNILSDTDSENATERRATKVSINLKPDTVLLQTGFPMYNSIMSQDGILSVSPVIST